MNRLTQWIADNPVITTWITLISLIGVVITVIALIMQIRDKKRKIICFIKNSNVLLDNTISCIDGIKVFFHQEEVNTIAVTTIKIWNGGNVIIEMSDFYPEKELKVIVPDTEKILAAIVVDQTEDTCKAGITLVKENEAVFTFYCLEPGQGATINLYHTNIEEEKTKVDGKMKGGKIVNKTLEILTENGEVIVSNGKYRVYLDGGVMGIGFNFYRSILRILGVTVKKRDKS